MRTVKVLAAAGVAYGFFAPCVSWGMSPLDTHVDTHHFLTQLIFQLAIIIIAANFAGIVFRRYLRLPSVLGEVVAGILIGPYALGRLAWPVVGPLFPLQEGLIPVTPELYGIAILASIVLLFMSGLETDVGMFLTYSLKGSVVGIGGILFSFLFGVWAALIFGLSDSWTDPAALFLGTISCATSIGITARILSERRKMESPEGVTVLSAAVFDDVLCIILLAIVTGVSRVAQTGAVPHWGQIGWIALKGIGFWLILTAIGLLSARRIARLVKTLRSPGIIAHISFGLALFLAGLSEMAGLAMIIGAYITGLALSQTDLVDVIRDQLQGVYHVLVPIFFCVMGMMVDLGAMRGVIGFGIVYTLLAVVSKVAGCGLAGLMTRFNRRGALRIGLGMLPRGEVALIVAGIGLSSGAIGSDLFGAAIMMTLLTTLAAPPLLHRSLAGGTGVRGPLPDAEEDTRNIVLEFPSFAIAEFLIHYLVRAFRNEEFFVYHLPMEETSYRIRKDDLSFTLTQNGNRVELTVLAKGEHIARYFLLEELLSLKDLFEAGGKIQSLDTMSAEIITGRRTGKPGT